MNKSLIKVSSGDVRAMAGDAGFKSYANNKNINIDKLPTLKMHSLYMQYLKSKGQ